jgi:hypothetical protein
VVGLDRKLDSLTRQFLISGHKNQCLQHESQVDDVFHETLERRAAEKKPVIILSMKDK